MIKLVRFTKRCKNVTREEFKDWWLNKHVELERIAIKKTPIRKIVVSFSTGEMVGGSEPPFDAMVEMYFDSAEEMRTFLEGEIHKSGFVRKGAVNFIDKPEEAIRTVAEEYTVAEK